MKVVEAKAKTRPEAIQKALSELGAELHEVEIEILDEGSKGLFGLGAREVHVRVKAEHIPDDKPRREERGRREGRERPRDRGPRQERGERAERKERPREERPREERRPRREPREDRPEAKPAEARADEKRSETTGGEEAGTRPARPRGRARTRGGRGRGRGRASEQQARSESEQVENRGGADRGRRGEPRRDQRREPRSDSDERRDARGRRDRPSDNGERRPQREPRPRREHTPKPRRERTEPIDPEKAAAMASNGAAILQEIVEKMGMQCTVTGTVLEDGEILLHIDSEDSAILIGRKGSTLHALQFIMNRILLQGEDSDAADRVIVDVERYRERRREALEEMARDMAARAKETGRTMRVKPLSPQERRIVHLALENDEGIRTYSLGSSVLRRVVIVPTDGADDNGANTEVEDEADDVYENVESDTEN